MKKRMVSYLFTLLLVTLLSAKSVPFSSWVHSIENEEKSRGESSLMEGVSSLGKAERATVNLQGLLVHSQSAKDIAARTINNENAYAFLSRSTIPGSGAFLEKKLNGDINGIFRYTAGAVGDTIVVTLVSEAGRTEDALFRIKYNGKVYKSHKKDFNIANDQTMGHIEKIVIPIVVAGDFDILVTLEDNDADLEYSLFVSGAAFSTVERNRTETAAYFRSYEEARSERAKAYAEKHRLPLTEYLPDGKMRTLIDVVGGIPQYYETFNIDAMKSTATQKVWPGGSLGLSLTGENFGRSIGIWDGGAVLTSHQEFGGRVTLGNNVATHDHATHVAGTMVATGVQAKSKGAAYKAKLKSYDWNSDQSEMNSEASNGLLVSQHSYGIPKNYNYSRNWDVLANNHPYYLPSKSAANEGPSYKTVTLNGNAKNILTVGSVNDLSNGWTSPSGVTVSSFSSRGPAPDGRIKPDIMGNGYQVYSPVDQHSSSYGTKSGTSMSGPNVAGSISLLQQHFFETHNSIYMLSHTLKCLVLHTANDAGTAGPDYASGWGVLNMEGAANLITANDAGMAGLIQELSLTNNKTETYEYAAEAGQDVVVTICWNDPAPSSNSGRALVNDLDLRVTMNGTEYMPWKMNPNSVSSGATKGDNTLDNVEQVYISNPSGSKFTVSVSHKGSLKSSSQKFAMCVSGGAMNSDPYVEVSAPNGGEKLIMGNTYEIKWADNLDENVAIELYKGNSKVKTIEASTASDGSYSWTLAEDLEAGTNYLIKVKGTDASDESDDYFEIVARPELEVNSPNGGESFALGRDMEITWSDNLAGKVDIKLSIGEGNDSSSSNLVLYEGWSAEVDNLGSSIDSGSAIVVNDIVSVTINQTAKTGSDYPWAQLSVYTGDNFRDVDSIEIEYKVSKDVLLTLPQEPLSATGESYFTTLTKATSWKKVTLPVNETVFKKPDWSSATDKLDLTKINSLSFSGDFTEYGGEVDIEIKNIILHGYVETPSIMVAKSVASSGSYTWKIPDTLTEDTGYIVTIISNEYPDFYDVSDKPFTIGTEAKELTLSEPNGGEEVEIGKEVSIKWETIGEIAKVLIELSIDNGKNWLMLASNVTNDGDYNWEVTQEKESSEALIRVSSSDGKIKDESDDVFSIVYGDAIIDVDGAQAESLTGFRVGPNPVGYGNEVFFQITPRKELLISGEIVVFDILGNSLSRTTVGYSQKDKTKTIGSWGLTKGNGKFVARGTYQAVLIVEVATGEVYRVRQNFTVTD